jgi:hypothetical protein
MQKNNTSENRKKPIPRLGLCYRDALYVQCNLCPLWIRASQQDMGRALFWDVEAHGWLENPQIAHAKG